MKHFQKVKELLVSIGFKNKNRIVAIIDVGVSIDTLKRTAIQTLRIQWRKPASQQLLNDLKTIAPVRPTIESYAHDVDKVYFIFEEQKSK